MMSVQPAASEHRDPHSFVLTPWARQRRPAPPRMVHGSGCYLIDDGGRRYLDLSAGLVAVNLGHGHPSVIKAIKAQADRLCYVSPALGNDVREVLAERLSAISPWSEGCRTFFTTGGGEANEDAVKMARMITGRHKVLTAYRSFHGSAPGAGSLTGEDRRWANEPGMPGVVRFFTPYPYRSPFGTNRDSDELGAALAHLELVLAHEGPHQVAALILEPFVGTNGVIAYPDGYLAGVRAITERHGILLIFDEVMTGFGRLGDRFAATRFGVEPDIMTVAKGVASAYVPLGGVMLREGLAQHFDERPLLCGHTYAGHPLSMAAGVAAIEALHGGGLFERGRTIELWMRELLMPLLERHEVIGDVRGLGAFFGLEFVRDRATKQPLVPWYGGVNVAMERLMAALRAEGVCAFGRYNVLLIAPPLTITRDELEEGVTRLERALLGMPPLSD